MLQLWAFQNIISYWNYLDFLIFHVWLIDLKNNRSVFTITNQTQLNNNHQSLQQAEAPKTTTTIRKQGEWFFTFSYINILFDIPINVNTMWSVIWLRVVAHRLDNIRDKTEIDVLCRYSFYPNPKTVLGIFGQGRIFRGVRNKQFFFILGSDELLLRAH